MKNTPPGGRASITQTYSILAPDHGFGHYLDFIRSGSLTELEIDTQDNRVLRHWRITITEDTKILLDEQESWIIYIENGRLELVTETARRRHERRKFHLYVNTQVTSEGALAGVLSVF